MESEKPLFIHSDEEMLLRIIQNLLRNAITHSAGDLTIRCWQEDQFAWLSFSNPIHTEELQVELLFDRFYTGARTRRKNTGLGLSIIRLLAEKLGGKATAEINNKQITFYICHTK